MNDPVFSPEVYEKMIEIYKVASSVINRFAAEIGKMASDPRLAPLFSCSEKLSEKARRREKYRRRYNRRRS